MECVTKAWVPKEDWPYQLPANWCWTQVKYVADVVTGGTPSKKHPEYYGESFPFYKPADLDAGRNVFEASEYLSDAGKQMSRIIPPKSTAVCCIGSIGKSGFLTRECATNQQINVAIPKCNPLFLYYYFQTDTFINELWSKASSTTISIVNKTKMEKCFFPLPPIPEQHRIVARIESLFAKLEEAKEKIKNVLEGAENRKAAILHKAFTGQLTANWRKENGVRDDSWEELPLGDVCIINPPKIDTKSLDDNLKVSFVPMADVSDIDGIVSGNQTRKLSEVKKGFTNFKEDDVVFAKITPCMENGKSAIIGKLVNDIGFGTTEFYVLRSSKKIYNRFLYHLVRSAFFRDEAKANMAGAVGQQRVPKAFMQEYLLKLPNIPEQQEIVRLLDNFLAKEKSIVATCEGSLATIEQMKKSILAKAFRGELGTNDPGEGSALSQ